MNGVIPATSAELFRLQTLGILLLVLRHRVIAFLAVVTLQRDDVSHKSNLLDNLGDGSGTDGASAFTDRESQSLLQRHRRDQLYR